MRDYDIQRTDRGLGPFEEAMPPHVLQWFDQQSSLAGAHEAGAERALQEHARTDRWEWDAEFEALAKREGRRQEQARRAGLAVEEEPGELKPSPPPKPALDPLFEEILARWRVL